MTYRFKTTPTVSNGGDGLIATALNGVVYTENSRLHVKGNADRRAPQKHYEKKIIFCKYI